MSSVLKGIAIRDSSRAPMQQLEYADVSMQQGIVGDARGGSRKRQVTILSEQDWTAVCEELKAPLHWSLRRANFLISDIQFSKQWVGTQLSIGEVLLQITRETNPCKRMDEAYPGLRHALKSDWRGGVCTKVIAPGRVKLGDPVLVLSLESQKKKLFF